MTWIEAYRTGIGMSRQEFAEAITDQLGRRYRVPAVVSEALIYRLECWQGCITHPKLANLIARACGATPEQRDMIVHKSQRGTWRGVDAPQLKRAREPRRPSAPVVCEETRQGNYTNHPTRSVVVLDRGGNTLARFPSIQTAAAFVGLSTTSVRMRCIHKTPREMAEGNACTCRYADEWDAMTNEQKRAHIKRAHELAIETRPGAEGQNSPRPVVVIDRQGRTLARYPGIGEAERAEGYTRSVISKRCRHEATDDFVNSGRTFRYACEWDNMTQEERLRDIGAAL